MSEILVGVVTFLCLVVASIASIELSAKLPARYLNTDTDRVVRLAANIFVVTTSLVLGLLLNSAKNTYESVDRNVHGLATDLILLDRSLRHYGPEAADVRQRLAADVQLALDDTWEKNQRVLDNRPGEVLLDDVWTALAAIRPTDPVRSDLWRDAEANLQNVVKRRWTLIEDSEGTIPTIFLIMLIAWLVLIFASFGFLAPRNAVTISTLVVAALLISASVYLILDMDVPFSGPIQISRAPLQRAAEQMRR